MITTIFVNVISALVFLFFFWRRLREDYVAEQIFGAAFFMLIGLSVGIVISKKFLPAWWFWADSLGLLLGLIVSVLRYNLRFFETLEGAISGLLPWLMLLFLLDSIKNSSLVSLLAGILVAFLISLFYYLDGHYKNFVWYRSGRIGFSGLATLGVFFLLRASVAPIIPFVLSFTGKSEVVVSAIAAFVLFFAVFNLAKVET